MLSMKQAFNLCESPSFVYYRANYENGLHILSCRSLWMRLVLSAVIQHTDKRYLCHLRLSHRRTSFLCLN